VVYRTVLIIFVLILQTIITAEMLSTGEKGVDEFWQKMTSDTKFTSSRNAFAYHYDTIHKYSH